MKAWWTAAELAGLPGLPGTERGVRFLAQREAWPRQRRQGRGGGWEYPISALPAAAQAEIARRSIARVAPPAEAPPPANENRGSVAALSGRRRSRAEARLVVLAAFDRYRRAGDLGLRAAEAAFTADYNDGRVLIDAEVRASVPDLGERTLRRWRRLDPVDLGGRYGRRRDSGKIEGNPAVRDIIVACLLGQPHWGAPKVLDALEARGVRGAARPSLRRLQGWIARWKAENAVLHAQATDPDSARSRFQPAFGSLSASVIRLNQRWEIDDTKGDVMCADGRHVLIAVIDVLTRRGKVLITPTSKATAVAALLRAAILDWGVPELLVSDNGAAYVSRHIQLAASGLSIRQDLCPPFTPEAKPHVERFIGTIQHDLFEREPGYVGHNVVDRQAIRNRAAFAKRLGESDGVLFQVAKTGAELQRDCDVWCEAIYARRPHEGLAGRTPFELAAEHARQARRVEDPRALDVLLAEPATGGGWRVVGKKGIKADGGLFVAGELGAHTGERVQVRLDAADLGRIVVFDRDGAFLCVAEDPERTGVDPREVAARAKAKYREAAAEGRAEARRLRGDIRTERIVEEILARAAGEASRIVAFPAPAEPHATAALRAASEAADALAARGAAPFDRPAPPAARGSSWEPPVAREASALPSPRPSREPAPIDWDSIHDMTGADEPPLSAPERILALWIAQNPDRASDAHRAWLAEELKNPHAQWLLDWSLKRTADEARARRSAAG